MNQQFWWYVARSSGMVAWAMATAAVLWGLFLSTKALGKNPRPPWLLDLHRYLGALTVAFTGIHLIALVADNFIHFSWAELFVPMASKWQPGAVAWGIVAFYLLAAVEITSLLKRKISKTTWRVVHLSSYLMFVLATAHGVTAGTDWQHPAVQWGALGGTLGLTFFVLYRFMAPKRRARRAVAQPAAA
jgi:DMSO/TMAO reductase YedYZ heme-binding membrane subunit